MWEKEQSLGRSSGLSNWKKGRICSDERGYRRRMSMLVTPGSQAQPKPLSKQQHALGLVLHVQLIFLPGQQVIPKKGGTLLCPEPWPLDEEEILFHELMILVSQPLWVLVSLHMSKSIFKNRYWAPANHYSAKPRSPNMLPASCSWSS